MMAPMAAVVVVTAPVARARVHAAHTADRRAAHAHCLAAHAAPPTAAAPSAHARRATAHRAHVVGHATAASTAAADSVAKAAAADAAAAGCHGGRGHGKHGRCSGSVGGAVRDAIRSGGAIGRGTVDGHRRAVGSGAIGGSHCTQDLGNEGHLSLSLLLFFFPVPDKARSHGFLGLRWPFHINTLFSLAWSTGPVARSTQSDPVVAVGRPRHAGCTPLVLCLPLPRSLLSSLAGVRFFFFSPRPIVADRAVRARNLLALWACR